MSYGQLQRWRASARSSVVGGRDEPPRRTLRFDDIERGWRVVDVEATPIGTVANSDRSLLTISRGVLMRKLYVPLTAVGAVHEGVVRLNVTRAWVEARDWDRPGRSGSSGS